MTMNLIYFFSQWINYSILTYRWYERFSFSIISATKKNYLKSVSQSIILSANVLLISGLKKTLLKGRLHTCLICHEFVFIWHLQVVVRWLYLPWVWAKSEKWSFSFLRFVCIFSRLRLVYPVELAASRYPFIIGNK
jgi:hypothetical protein